MRFVLLLIAAVVAVAAGVAALQLSGKKEAAPQPAAAAPRQAASPGVSTVEVLVAKEAIPVGTVLEDGMVDRQPWPEHLVLEGFVTADAKVAGRVARTGFQAREPLMNNKLANPNDPSFLAAALPSGQRAVTIATDAISGVAGYVFPGDRVDVVLTHNIPEEIRIRSGQAQSVRRDKPELSEVLVPNARVLAVNTRSTTGKESAAAAPLNVTLAVSELSAQMIRLGEKNGTLSLSLRSIRDLGRREIPPLTGLQHLTRGDISSPAGDTVRVVRGAGKGGDARQAPFMASPYADSDPDAAPVTNP